MRDELQQSIADQAYEKGYNDGRKDQHTSTLIVFKEVEDERLGRGMHRHLRDQIVKRYNNL